MPYCVHCGQKVSDTAKFCTNCGEKIASTNSSDELKIENNIDAEAEEKVKSFTKTPSNFTSNQIRINKASVEKNDLLLMMINSWRNEHLGLSKVVIIINVLLSILFILVMPDEWFLVCMGIFTLTFPLWLPGIIITVYRSAKSSKIKTVLANQFDIEIEAKVENKFYLRIGKSRIGVPLRYLPLSPEKCAEIINTINHES